MKNALYHDSQSSWHFPLFAEDSQHKPPTNSEVVARGCKLPHIVFSEHRGASFRSWSFRSPSFFGLHSAWGLSPKKVQKAAPSFTPSHPLPVAVSHTSAAKALSHQTLQSASTLTTSTPRMAEDVRARMAQRTRPKCVPRFSQSCSHQSQKIARITCPFRAWIAFSRCVVSAKYNQTCWKLLVLTCNDIPTESPPLRQIG